VVFALVRLPFLRKAKARRQAQDQAAAAAQADTDEAPLQPRPDEREQRRPTTPPRDNLRVEPRI